MYWLKPHFGVYLDLFNHQLLYNSINLKRLWCSNPKKHTNHHQHFVSKFLFVPGRLVFYKKTSTSEAESNLDRQMAWFRSQIQFSRFTFPTGCEGSLPSPTEARVRDELREDVQPGKANLKKKVYVFHPKQPVFKVDVWWFPTISYM